MSPFAPSSESSFREVLARRDGKWWRLLEGLTAHWGLGPLHPSRGACWHVQTQASLSHLARVRPAVSLQNEWLPFCCIFSAETNQKPLRAAPGAGLGHPETGPLCLVPGRWELAKRTATGLSRHDTVTRTLLAALPWGSPVPSPDASERCRRTRLTRSSTERAACPRTRTSRSPAWESRLSCKLLQERPRHHESEAKSGGGERGGLSRSGVARGSSDGADRAKRCTLPGLFHIPAKGTAPARPAAAVPRKAWLLWPSPS